MHGRKFSANFRGLRAEIAFDEINCQMKRKLARPGGLRTSLGQHRREANLGSGVIDLSSWD
jgi:hypothetical protein